MDARAFTLGVVAGIFMQALVLIGIAFLARDGCERRHNVDRCVISVIPAQGAKP